VLFCQAHRQLREGESATLSPPQHDWSGTSEQYTSPEKNTCIQSREEVAWWYVVCVHNNNNNFFFFFFFFFFLFLLGRNYTKDSKLQQQQSFKPKNLASSKRKEIQNLNLSTH